MILKKHLSHNNNCNNANEYFWKACLHGNLEVVKFFVKDGVNVNEKDKKGYTAIFKAVFSGKLEIVKFLVENGADINTCYERLIDAASRNSNQGFGNPSVNVDTIFGNPSVNTSF